MNLQTYYHCLDVILTKQNKILMHKKKPKYPDKKLNMQTNMKNVQQKKTLIYALNL